MAKTAQQPSAQIHPISPERRRAMDIDNAIGDLVMKTLVPCAFFTALVDNETDPRNVQAMYDAGRALAGEIERFQRIAAPECFQ